MGSEIGDRGIDLLSSVTVFSKYARYLPSKKRRESWDEICDRYELMMNTKFPQYKEEINVAIQYVREKKLLPSMRALQFAGIPIERNNARGYNCSYSPINHYRAFDEAMFLLLSGCGYGFSVQKHHVDQLPAINPLFKSNGIKERKFLVNDSLEGWAEAVKVLMKAYFGLAQSKPRFDFSDIRAKGARLITSGGKAPGPFPLQMCLFMIESILESKTAGSKLTPIECHDIICHVADAVLTGGIRRAALISLFSFDDDEMISCKSGNWWETNPQRGRANNSVVIVRNKIKEEEFLNLWDKIKSSNAGEPGVYFTNDKDYGTNPCCFAGDAKLSTEDGYKRFDELQHNSNFLAYNINGELVPCKVWSNGKKKIIYIKLSNGKSIECTPDHKFMTVSGESVEAQNLKGLRLMPDFEINQQITEFTKYGFVQGDGGLGRLKSEDHKGMEIHFGEKDADVAEIFDSSVGKQYIVGYNDVLREYGFSSNQLPDRGLPESLYSWTYPQIQQFLKGLYSANGSVIKGHRVSLKSTCYRLITEVQGLLRSLGIESYITTNKAKEVKFSNGNYTCKESYDLNITQSESVCMFAGKIGFIHKYKQESLIDLIKCKAPLVSAIYNNDHERDVFDFSLDDDTHWGVVEGVIAHNCEISLRPNTFCNLCEINGSNIEDEYDFYDRCDNAAFLGTLQATFTDFHYLRPIWQINTEKDFLVGVGITGIASNKLTDDMLIKGSAIVKRCNALFSEQLGIKPAARTTTIKPSGTTSCVLGTSSGIHAWHNDYYIRRMRFGKNEPIYKYILDTNPHLVEDEYFKPKQQCVISIPIKAPDNSITRDESALDLLERVHKFNTKWVQEGHNRGPNYNNVSATISIKDDEWVDVGNWMWANRGSYNGISVLNHDNGSYIQAPFEDITKEQYDSIVSQMVDINLNDIVEEDDDTDLAGEVACAGGLCEI